MQINETGERRFINYKHFQILVGAWSRVTVQGPTIPPVSLPAVWAWEGFSGAQKVCLCFWNRRNLVTWRERWKKKIQENQGYLSIQDWWVGSEAAVPSQQERTEMLSSVPSETVDKWGITPLWWFLRLIDFWNQSFFYLKEIHRVNS